MTTQSLIWLGLGLMLAGMFAARRSSRAQTVTKAFGQAPRLHRIGMGLMLIGLVSSGVGWVVSAPEVPTAVSFSYETFGPGWSGQFKKEGAIWKEYNKENAGGRVWTPEPSARKSRIRLVDGGAIIEIEPRTNTIYYTEPGRPGYPQPTPIYRIIGD